jgi:MFS family permease
MLAVSVFLSYLAVALPLSAVAIFVHQRLGLSSALAGLAVGICFLSTVATRWHVGALTDRAGANRVTLQGLAVYALASVICLLAALPSLGTATAFAVLILGRLILGLGESLTVVGFMAWAVGYAGQARSGQVLAILGAGMYGAYAVGGPLGLWLYARYGFGGLMLASAVIPGVSALLFRTMPAVAPSPGRRASFFMILGRIWREGSTVGLQGVGFAAIGAFISLDFAAHGWTHPGLALTAFGGGFVISRLTCGGLPDRFGGQPVALASLSVELVGQLALWLAGSEPTALFGALLTGLGCSMIFPAMGSDVVKRLDPSLRGVAMGAFSAFQDLSYGLTGPVVGLFVDRQGFPFAFLIGACSVAIGLALTAGGLFRQSGGPSLRA